MKSKQATINTASLSDLSGYSRSSLYDFAARKVLPAPDNDQWEAAATIRALIKYLREGKDADAYRTARTKRMQAQADRERTRADFERGLYLPKSEIGPALRNLSLHQKAKLQHKLESELAPKLAGLNPLEIQAHMAQAVDEIVSVFRNGVRDWMEKPPAV
jgi:hypothetical protein